MSEISLSSLNVSRETKQKLDIYADLLRRWQARINLVSPTTLPDLWNRHFVDSLQVFALAPDARLWADLGSGAGFPGLVIAIALADISVVDTGKTAKVHLFESNGKKCAFLREVIRETGCPAVVEDGRIEDKLLASTGFDVVTARALAPLHKLLSFTEEVLKTGTRALFLKGQDVELELDEASTYWNFDPKLHPSRVDPRGVIVDIHEIKRR